MLNEISQRKTNTIWYHICMKCKNNSNEFIYKTETESRHRKQANGCQKGDEEGKDEYGIWD